MPLSPEEATAIVQRWIDLGIVLECRVHVTGRTPAFSGLLMRGVLTASLPSGLQDVLCVWNPQSQAFIILAKDFIAQAFAISIEQEEAGSGLMFHYGTYGLRLADYFVTDTVQS